MDFFELWFSAALNYNYRPRSFNSCSAVDGAIILIHDPDSKKKTEHSTSLVGMTDEQVKAYYNTIQGASGGVQTCSAPASGKSTAWFWTLGCLSQRKDLITQDWALGRDTLLLFGTQHSLVIQCKSPRN